MDRVIELLRIRGRISYRVLKREFELDDEQVEDLKDELIYAKRLAVDEDERVLVWVGESDQRNEQQPATKAKPAPRKAKPTKRDRAKAQKPTTAHRRPVAAKRDAPEAERR